MREFYPAELYRAHRIIVKKKKRVKCKGVRKFHAELGFEVAARCRGRKVRRIVKSPRGCRGERGRRENLSEAIKFPYVKRKEEEKKKRGRRHKV